MFVCLVVFTQHKDLQAFRENSELMNNKYKIIIIIIIIIFYLSNTTFENYTQCNTDYVASYQKKTTVYPQ